MDDAPESNVVPFPGVVLETPEVDEDIVAMLERYLTLAKDGQLQFVGIAAVDRRGRGSSGWEAAAYASKSAAIGAASVLLGRLTQDAVDTSTPTQRPSA